jgi:2-succinyl-5-enolpyruvyl-6-hydroxy-3-cyclohexene-1-carboxylate synthase
MPAENAGRAFALVLVDELVRHGVRHAVIAPGSRSTPIALALLENPHVRVHVRIDERSAAYLALGIAKASVADHAIVPVLCTSGTAAAHFHGAVLEADLARVPLLVLTADRPPELRGTGANQTVDQVGLYGGAVRWACDVGVPESRPDSVQYWRSTVSRAAAHLLGRLGGPAGPVHLNLPLREPLGAVADGVGFRYDIDDRQSALGAAWTVTAAVTEPPPAELIDLVRSCERGVVVAGDCFGAGGAAALAERLGWPLIAEPHSGERHGPQALRAADAVLRDQAFTTDHRPDLVVVIGRIGLSRVVTDWLGTVPHVVLAAGSGWWDVTRRASAVFGWSPSWVDALGESAPADPGWTASWRAAAEDAADQIDAILDAAPVLTEPQVARDVAALVPDDGTLVVASSMPIRDLDLVMRPRDRLTVMANRGVSGIDGFVSTAQGVAIGTPAAGPTVALCGDLSLLHDVNGLIPGPTARPDVSYVVINNDGGGIFSLLPQRAGLDTAAFERLFGTPHGLSLERLAAAYDADYRLVRTRADLADALSTYGGVRIIEARTDRADNAVLHERLRAVRLGGWLGSATLGDGP